MNRRPRRLLVLRALGLGDFLTGVPAYRALARAFPEHRRILAAPAVLAPLAALAGGIDEVADTRPLAPLAGELRHVDVAVNLHGRGPQSHRVLLDLEPRRLIAFANAEAGWSGPGWSGDEHEVARWCRLLAESGIAADVGDLDLAVPQLAVPEQARGATLLHCGAKSIARRWPLDRWAAVARAEAAAGRGVILTGSAEERGDALQIAAAAGIPAEHVYAGRTDLLTLAALVAAAGAVASSDTGVAHLATAYRRPSVVLFGPVPPAWWGPPHRPYHRVIWRGLSGNALSTQVDPGILAIGSDQVIGELAALRASFLKRERGSIGAAAVGSFG